ncbi:MAG TPA: hypothetical protein VMG59_11645 [Phycisphaerae bacterium]|nr:hypothetical protein [Phycisphaerae bacterium]
MPNIGFYLSLNALILLVGGMASIWALKILRRLEFFAPAPAGAKAVRTKYAVGDFFPMAAIPEHLRDYFANGPVVFLFLTPNCPGCKNLIPAVSALAMTYRNIHFIIRFDSEKAKNIRSATNIHIISTDEIINELELSLFPCAMKTGQGKIVAYGIVNNIEHFENVVEAKSLFW